MCRDIYIKSGHVARFASYRCKSKIYPEIETIATRCNDVKECDGDEDEKNCSDIAHTKQILVVAICLSLGIFLGMKLPQAIHFIKNNNENNIENEETEEDNHRFNELIQILRADPESAISIQNVNKFLLYIQHSKKSSVVKKTYVQFYDSLVVMFEHDLAKLFAFLKAHIHPAVTADVVEQRYRGLKTKIIDYMEVKVIRHKIITHCTNKATEKPILRLALSSLACLVGLLSHILDTVKDSLLALTLLHIIGLRGIIYFPTNFSAAVVVSWTGTIFVPILLSSVHLALTDPFLVFNSARLRAMRWGWVLAALGCLVLSPLNTVVLKTRHEMKKQEAINSAISLSDDTLDLFRECDVIEAKLLEYLHHEMGIF